MSDMSTDRQFEALLDYIRRSHGFDFSGYKRSSLMRRILRRMQVVGVDGYSNYMDYLEVHPEEFQPLFNTILINVTSFFRDAQAWEYLTEEILPRILEAKKSGDYLRVWSAGCASGEEAYTLAIMLAERLGVSRFIERVKLFATDVDEEALTKARHASYCPREIAGIPEPLLGKYFERSTDGNYVFHKEMRRVVIFGRHDLAQDAPISRVDLLTCRNTLMYFHAEAQARILARLHFALADGGFLFLGKAEMLLTHTNLFVPVDMKQRVFSRVPRARNPEQLLPPILPETEEIRGPLVNDVRFREAAFETAPVAQIVVDLEGILTLANQQARALLGVRAQDLGRPLKDREFSYRPVELRSPIEQVLAERHPVVLRDVRWPEAGGEPRYLDVHVAPLVDPRGALFGVSLGFPDVTRHKLLQGELQVARQELETAYEELQSAHEELETTNEELQSTVEELETTNEELQSTNEELETMNEELQSTNEELETINTELRQRTTELNEVNLFLEAILTGMRGGVVVLDENLQVQVWNHKSEDLWGLRADEVHGKPFMNLDIGLPVEKLKGVLRECAAGATDCPETTLEAVNRRGKSIVCRVSCSPLLGGGGETRGAILMVEDGELG